MPTANYTFHSKKNLQTGIQFSAVIDVPASTGELTAKLDASSMTGAGQECKLTIEISEDGGATFTEWASLLATTEPRNTKGDPLRPQFVIPFTFAAPLKARCLIEVINGPFQVGASGSVVFN